jgi:hypothetical protein
MPLDFRCIFRDIRESWRATRDLEVLAFYCPISEKTTCAQLLREEPLPLRLQFDGMSLSNWSTDFILNPRFRGPNVFKSEENRLADVAVCAVRPYASSDLASSRAWEAMFSEWIHHYTKLGVRIFVYERPEFSHANTFQDLKSVTFYNFTMFTAVLESLNKQIRFSSETLRFLPENAHRNHMNDDKVATLTHCRFEIRALYGIDNVMALDFDEFLYDSNRLPTYADQIKGIETALRLMKNNHIEQNTFDQKLPCLLSEENESSFKNCISSKTPHPDSKMALASTGKRKKESILACFGPMSKSAPNTKSIQVGFACPILGFHHSCEYDIEKMGALNSSDPKKKVYRQGCRCKQSLQEKHKLTLEIYHYSMNLNYYKLQRYLLNKTKCLSKKWRHDTSYYFKEAELNVLLYSNE